jgi:hypothetical protein
MERGMSEHPEINEACKGCIWAPSGEKGAWNQCNNRYGSRDEIRCSKDPGLKDLYKKRLGGGEL